MDKLIAQSFKIMFKSGRKIILLPVSKIQYIEGDNNKTKIHMENSETISCSEKLKEIELKIEAFNFYRCHHSFIVNLNHVLAFDFSHHIAELESGLKVPISRSRKKQLLNPFKKPNA